MVRMVRRLFAALLLLPALSATVVAGLRADRLDPQPRSRPSVPRGKNVTVREIAQDALDNHLRVAEHSGDPRAIVDALLDLSRFNRERERGRLAVDYSRRALIVAEKTGSRELIRLSWEELVSSQDRAGDAAGALASYRRFKEESDRLSEEEKKKQIDILEQKYQFERQANTMERERREAAVRTLAADRRRFQRNLLGGSSILLGLIGFGIYRRRVASARLGRELAVTDPLTGLKNRRYMLLTMGGDIAAAQRKRRNAPFGVRPSDADLVFLLIDLDRFKSVNDELGHQAGDTMLIQVADVLRESCRASDTIARWGGDEFLLVSRFSDRRTGSVLAERIRTAIEQRVFELGEGHTVQRTCSIGFASFPFSVAYPDALTWEQVVAVVDQALYRAKRAGSNKWVGVTASDTAAEEQFRQRPGNTLEQWIEDGTVTTESWSPVRIDPQLATTVDAEDTESRS
jgi:diguanylate cyclase (GGDEF)-like protein